MKKLFLLICILTLAGSIASASSFKYMEFKTKAGITYTIGSNGLVLTVSGETLSAVNSADEHLTFPVAELQSMQFTDVSSGVEALSINEDGEISVFDLNGIKIGKFVSLDSASQSLDSGVYIIKNKAGQTFKTIIGK